jgi:hypothetical protein
VRRRSIVVLLLLLPKVRASVARRQKAGRCVVRSRADNATRRLGLSVSDGSVGEGSRCRLSLSGGLKKAARSRCIRHRSLVFSRRACLPVTPSRGRGWDLHSARRDDADLEDVPYVAAGVDNVLL